MAVLRRGLGHIARLLDCFHLFTSDKRQCDVCKWLDIPLRQYLPVPLDKLRDSCGSCQLVKSVMEHFSEGDVIFKMEIKRLAEAVVLLFDTGPAPTTSGRTKYHEIIIYTRAQCAAVPSLRPMTARHYSRHVGLTTAADFVRQQIGTCMKEWHRSCPKTPASTLPKRVISTDPSAIRLIETQGLVGQYATLSHCWGNAQPLMTTMKTLPDMLTAIPEDRLPILFIEAIRLARELDIPYIWIDSLCIVQDSPDDWELESAKMCEYYSNTWINIAAVTSPDHTVSFLKDRDARWSPVPFSLTEPSGQAYDLSARRVPAMHDPRQRGSLFSRAWAYQESALASRTIHFTDNDMVWECRYGTEMHTFLANHGPFGTSSMLFGELDDSGGLSSRRLFEIWDLVVSEYTERKLAFVTDKLPAISGVAARLQQATKGRYLAGIWEETMPANLCWYSVRVRAAAPVYLAPSWSWASVMSRTNPMHHDMALLGTAKFTPYVTVLEAHCDVPGLNPFGTIASGRLRLRGKIVSATLQSDLDQWVTLSDAPEWLVYSDSFLAPTPSGGIARSALPTALSEFQGRVRFLLIGKVLIPDTGYFRCCALILGTSETDPSASCRLGLACLDRDGRAGLFDGVKEEEVLII